MEYETRVQDNENRWSMKQGFRREQMEYETRVQDNENRWSMKQGFRREQMEYETRVQERIDDVFNKGSGL